MLIGNSILNAHLPAFVIENKALQHSEHSLAIICGKYCMNKCHRNSVKIRTKACMYFPVWPIFFYFFKLLVTLQMHLCTSLIKRRCINPLAAKCITNTAAMLLYFIFPCGVIVNVLCKYFVMFACCICEIPYNGAYSSHNPFGALKKKKRNPLVFLL